VAEVERLVSFTRQLREAGVRPGTDAVGDFCRATALLGVEEVYWAGRATLVSRRDDIPTYDRVFDGFFAGERPAPKRPPPRLRLVTAGAAGDEGGETGEAEAPRVARASRIELLRHKSFERCTDAELAELAALAGGFARSLPRRRSRRRAEARSGVLDLRSTFRRSLRTEGEPFERRFRRRPLVPRRLVLLIDVSGSMSGTSRGLLVLAHAVLRIHPRTDVFCFGTRITRVTPALATRRADDALTGVARAVADWEGGTRIGDSLRALLDRSGRRGTVRGATVVLCSDGLDVGEPDVLARQMQRLSLLAHRVVWLNPLKADAGYEPLARGMQAALPFVDVFADGSNLASIEEIALRLSGRPMATR
jgi:uncharacterized protein with von Willebrand factor type A (vWA) domain